MEDNSSILQELSSLKKEFEEFKKKFAEFSELTLREANRKNTERPFGMLHLPSKGLFYKNRNKFLLIGYLTYFEENILTSEMMHEADIAMPIILEKVIASNDFDVREILSCDVQAISMFLRAYAYGNNIEIDVECPHCSKKDKHTIMISNFKSKDLVLKPDENGEIPVVSPKFGKQFKIKPRTYFEEIEFRKEGEKKQIELMCFNITEFEGDRNKESILRTLSALKIMESRDIKKAIADNLPGVDTNVNYTCAFCERDTQLNFGTNGADFLRLPSAFINNILEEMFLLVHYGKSITVEDVKKMNVGERRWMINRLSEELTKKKEAEEAAVRSAKSKSKSKKF
jgi:hypothetical protein